MPAERIIPIKGGEDYELGGYSVRVLPKHAELGTPFEFVPVRWG